MQNVVKLQFSSFSIFQPFLNWLTAAYIKVPCCVDRFRSPLRSDLNYPVCANLDEKENYSMCANLDEKELLTSRIYSLNVQILLIVTGICNPSSCILRICNPVTHPDAKRISFSRIINPDIKYSWDCKSQQQVRTFCSSNQFSISARTGEYPMCANLDEIRICISAGTGELLKTIT